MIEVGAYEAKTHLSELLARVSQGEKIVITKHGSPIALLLPAGQRQKTTSEVIRDIHELRKGIKAKGYSLKALIEEGRR